MKVAGQTPVGEPVAAATPEAPFEPDAASTGVLAGHEGTETMAVPAPWLTVEKVLDGAAHTLSVTGTTGTVPPIFSISIKNLMSFFPLFSFSDLSLFRRSAFCNYTN